MIIALKDTKFHLRRRPSYIFHNVMDRCIEVHKMNREVYSVCIFKTIKDGRTVLISVLRGTEFLIKT